ncbi:Tubulin polymerization-promoting protein like [Pseudolycoriella hygida]|uniref:Tubulin polymerization-promoting protein like n=1 Tax=Pseudolycoriella hygida TaxID=35572 RepID=A0A9Q0MNF5_9DIPT|nr:Tubulin polymerization-promoting protein like [Pseudolycoriella hygida]
MVDSNKFDLFSRFGDTQSDGTTITLKNSDKWMKEAKLFTKTFTTTDTGIAFSKFKVKKMNFVTYQEFVKDLCNSKKIKFEEFVDKLNSCNDPAVSSATKPLAMGVTDRLTDTTKYTGAHKARFGEDGKGKGLEGREDLHDNEGYVQAYKGKDTFDKKH